MAVERRLPDFPCHYGSLANTSSTVPTGRADRPAFSRRAPDYESGGRRFESVRARHVTCCLSFISSAKAIGMAGCFQLHIATGSPHTALQMAGLSYARPIGILPEGSSAELEAI